MERTAWSAALLTWLAWDTSKLAEMRDEAVRCELAIPIKVAAFAEGGKEPGDHSRSSAVQRFETVRKRTHCVFAPTALLWGNDWVEDPFDGDSLGMSVARALPRFYRFCLEVKAGAPIDGFVFEVRGERYSTDLETFAHTVRRVLTGISASDPAGVHCMSKGYIHKKGWYFQFAREPLFVTTFAPCYPENNPRFQFCASPGSCFVLFQPEESFLRHDLPPDKPRKDTNWDCPADVRDRIRANFRRNGREYRVPDTVAYPPANFIVAPMDVLVDPPCEFWRSQGVMG